MFDVEIRDAANRWNVPEAWIKAVIQTESSWNPKAYRFEQKINDASYGLMQLLYSTARGLGFSGPPEGLYDPQLNIDLGTKLLGDLRSRYGDDFRRVYSAYNSGRPDLWQTSSQVAANVTRAVANLTQWVQASVQTLTQAPEEDSAVAIIVLVLLLAWAGKRK